MQRRAVPPRNWERLTVGLLETSTGTWTTELLGLAAAVVGDEEGTVELGEGLLQQVLGVLIDEPINTVSQSSIAFSIRHLRFGWGRGLVLLVEGDQGLGDGLTHSAVQFVSIPVSQSDGPWRLSHSDFLQIAETVQEKADILDLRGVTTTGDTDADVEVGELVETDNKEGLVDLEYGIPSALL